MELNGKGIVVCPNTGLGDVIVMNGAVRYLAKKYQEVHLLSLPCNFKHLEFIYRNEPNIKTYYIVQPQSPRQVMLRFKKAYSHIKKLNPHIKFDPYKFHWCHSSKWAKTAKKLRLGKNTIWQKIFYKHLGVPYEVRYSHFDIPRDHDAEQELLGSLNLPKKYAFVVNKTSSRNAIFNVTPETDLPIVNPTDFDRGYRPLSSTLLFDWSKIIENAKEIHTVDTGWMHLIRSLKLKVPKFFYDQRNVFFSQADEYLNDKGDSGWTRIKP